MHGEITILLADSRGLIRAGIRTLLSTIKNLIIVEEAETGIKAYDLARKQKPDLLILDADLPVLNGLEAWRRVRVSCPRIKFIVLSYLSGDAVVQEFLRAGAVGFVVKDQAKKELIDFAKKNNITW